MYGSKEFIKDAIESVYDLAKSSFDPTDNITFTSDNVYVVSHSYILGNQKAMLSTTLQDGKYYEVTYNADKNEIYVDTYMRVMNTVYKHVDEANDSVFRQK